jgi:hypothetical protein
VCARSWLAPQRPRKPRESMVVQAQYACKLAVARSKKQHFDRRLCSHRFWASWLLCPRIEIAYYLSEFEATHPELVSAHDRWTDGRAEGVTLLQDG